MDCFQSKESSASVHIAYLRVEVLSMDRFWEIQRDLDVRRWVLWITTLTDEQPVHRPVFEVEFSEVKSWLQRLDERNHTAGAFP